MVGLGPAGPELITAGTLALLAGAVRSSCAPPGIRRLLPSRRPARSTTTTSGPRPSTRSTGPSWTTWWPLRSTGGAGASTPCPGRRRWPSGPWPCWLSHPRVVSGEVDLVVHPAVSFLDLAFARLGVDPVAAGVRVVDGEAFAVDAAGERGPLLVAQCWSRAGALRRQALGRVAARGAGDGPPPPRAGRRAGRATCRGTSSTAPSSPTT